MAAVEDQHDDQHDDQRDDRTAAQVAAREAAMAATQDAADEEAERAREISLTMDLCLRIGELLLSSGAGAADVSATMRSVADHMGLRQAELDVTFTTLSMNYQRGSDDVPTFMVRHVKRRDIDYDDLTTVDHLVRDILTDQVDLYLARTRMATIVSVGHTMPRWVVTLANGVMCAAIAVFLGVGVPGSVVAFVSALLIDRVQLALGRMRLPFFYLQVAGGAVASLVAVAVAASPINADLSLVVSANIIMLLAGIGLMGAVQDALTGFYITSGARMIEAMMATAGIIAGVGIGISVGRTLGVSIGQLVPGRVDLESLPILMTGAALAAAAFSAACYAPRRAWLPVGVTTALASVVSSTLTARDFDRAIAAAGAAFFIGLVAYAVAGKFRVPPLVVAVPAIVPFLPGLSIYRGLSLLADGGSGTSEGILALITAISVAIALASGVILGEYVAQPVKREARRLEDRLAGPRLVGPYRALTRAERRQARREAREADESTSSHLR